MKIKSVLFAASLVLNAFFILILLLSVFSKSSFLSYSDPGQGYFTAAAVVSSPPSSQVVFDLIEITLSPGEKAYLQFSFISSKKQGNFLINALFDPDIISVSPSGYGLEITALSYGSTLMQTFNNDGIRNVAEVTVK